MKTAIKRKKEKNIVELMIKVYCCRKHDDPGILCSDCQELMGYSFERIDKCPFMEKKKFCSTCETHCYSSEMRDKIRLVMRYSGPRILFRHPIMATRHLLTTLLKNINR